jgi:hypothetical protein
VKFHALFRAPWTQESIARGLGCSRQLVTNWANGATPHPDAARALWELVLQSASPLPAEAMAVDASGATWGDAERAALAAVCSPRWSQAAMAKELARSRQTICLYATGRCLPKPRTAIRINELEPDILVSDWYR